MLTILGARYSNPGHSAAVIETVERGAVLVSSADNPDIWPQVLAANPAPFQEPVAPAPPISDRQFFHALALQGTITEAEALSAVQVGTIPLSMEPTILSLPANQQFGARMLLCGATVFERTHPMTLALAAGHGWTEQQLDALWATASSL